MHLRKHNLISILLMLLMLGNIVGAVWIYPDVDIVTSVNPIYNIGGNFTLNTKSPQNFTSVEIGAYYTNLSWDGVTYHNITYVTTIRRNPPSVSVIDLIGECEMGNYIINLSFDVYAPIDWTVTILSAEVITELGETESLSFTGVQMNSTQRTFTTLYNPSNTLNIPTQSYFRMNVSLSAENDTLFYNGSFSTGLHVPLFTVEKLDPPYNVTSTFNGTWSSINTSWDTGNNSDFNVIVRNNNTYPICPADGYEVQNSTSIFYNVSVTTGDEFYLAIFSYSTATHAYSNATNLPWGGIQLQCFNESNPSQAINFDIEITNSDATQIYTASDVSNGQSISFDDIPYGDNTVIIISNSSYKLRTYYKDLDFNHFYNYSFYLPPLTTPIPPGEDPGEGELRTCTNVALVTNPAINATISLTYSLDSIISVYRYDNIPTYTSYTDSISVTNPAVNVTINFTRVPNSITAVYIYNNTLYGGWVLVPQDMYTYNSTEVEIDNSWLDANTSMARVDYLYISSYIGNWYTVPDSMYTASSTAVEIDNATLNNDTTMVKASYYYMYYSGDVIDTQLYILCVVGPQGEYTSPPIENAKIIVKRYINTSDSYEEIASLLTDANGNVEVYLIPETHLKIFVSKEGYKETISDYIPSIDVPTKTFRLYPEEQEYLEYDLFSDIITFKATMNENATILIEYCDSNETTVNTTINLYNLSGTGNNRTLIDSTFSTSNCFSYYVYGIDRNLTHLVKMWFNNTATFDVDSPVTLMVLAQFNDPHFFDIDDRIKNVIGPAEFGVDVGWHNIIAFMLPLIFLVSFGVYNTTLGIFAFGTSLGLIQGIYAIWMTNSINPLLIALCPIAIAIGVIYAMITNKAEGGL